MTYSPAADVTPGILLVAVINDALPSAILPEQIAALTRAGANAFFAADEATRAACLRLGVNLIEADSEDIIPTESLAAAWRALANGERTLFFADLLDADGLPGAAWPILRMVAPFVVSFGEILNRGKLSRNLASVRGGLLAHETRTSQSGSILWIENPDPDRPLTGSVFPVLPEITLAPNAVFPYVHDAPIGTGASYLGAYAGLVKSDADVLAAHILPDPHDGIRVYVYGTPGTTREVAVWSGNDRGRGVDVTFDATTPRVYVAGLSQIIALPTDLAATVWQHPTDDSAPVLIGPLDVLEHDTTSATILLPRNSACPVYVLRSDGSFDDILPESPLAPTLSNFPDDNWLEIEDITFPSAPTGAGWYRSHVDLPDGDGGDAQIDFPTPTASLTLWVNGEPATPSASVSGKTTFDLRLRDGGNTLTAFASSADGLSGPITLVPTGGCYLINISHWRFHPAEDTAAVRLSTVEIAF